MNHDADIGRKTGKRKSRNGRTRTGRNHEPPQSPQRAEQSDIGRIAGSL